MSPADDHLPDEDGDDLTAAEYVLGVLPPDERTAVSRRIDVEPAFARTVERWEARFSSMADAYLPVQPPESIKAAIDRRLFAAESRDAEVTGGLWSNLAFWRGLTAAATATMIALAVISFVPRPSPEPQARYVASLAVDGSDVRYLAFYDPVTQQVAFNHMSGSHGPDRDFELWVIDSGQPPVSMGVIPAGSSVHLPVDVELRSKLTQGAVLAISLEPTGGSPTGQPTGPVVAAGDLRGI